MPNNHLVLGLEFGPQRIRDLAIVCPLGCCKDIDFSRIKADRPFVGGNIKN